MEIEHLDYHFNSKQHDCFSKRNLDDELVPKSSCFNFCKSKGHFVMN